MYLYKIAEEKQDNTALYAGTGLGAAGAAGLGYKAYKSHKGAKQALGKAKGYRSNLDGSMEEVERLQKQLRGILGDVRSRKDEAGAIARILDRIGIRKLGPTKDEIAQINDLEYRIRKNKNNAFDSLAAAKEEEALAHALKGRARLFGLGAAGALAAGTGLGYYLNNNN
jgi:hypothetical protein